MEKQIKIVVAGSGDEKDLMISPGATVGETVEEAGLNSYQLARKGQEPLAPDTDLYKEAADSETFYATPSKVAVGGGGSASLSNFFNLLKIKVTPLISRIKGWLEKLRDRSIVFKQKRIRVIKTRSFRTRAKTGRVKVRARALRKGKGARLVGADKGIPYWQENGWVKTKKGYKGNYKTNYGKWRGFIQDNYKSNYSFYILDPPAEVKRSAHGPCFFYLGDGIHFVHFSKKPRDASSGIMTIEKVICESFSGKGA